MFEKRCVLNFNLIDTLITSGYVDKIDILFKQLSNEHDITVKFINEYIDRSKYQEVFINKL